MSLRLPTGSRARWSQQGDHELLWMRSGWASRLEHSDDSRDRFDTASITKLFTAV